MPARTEADLPAGKGTGRFALTSPFRLAVMVIGAVAVAEIVAMALLHAVKAPPFWPATLLDAAIMVTIVCPPLYVLGFRPLTRLINEHRRTGNELERRTHELEALYTVTAAATRQLDVDRLLSEVVDVVKRLLEADGGWVLINGQEPGTGMRFLGACSLPATVPGTDARELFARCPSCRDCVREESCQDKAPVVKDCTRLSASVRE